MTTSSTESSRPSSADTTSTAGSGDRDPRPPGRGARNRWLAICVVVAVGTLALDQATKALVRARLALGDTWPEGWELIRITHVRNTGAAFGILPDATEFLTIASIVMCVVIGVVVLRMVATRPGYALGLSLLLGGAIGNQIDRVRLGYVTDFIDPARYPSFNVADSAVVIGIVALILLSLFDREEEPATAGEVTASSGASPERAEYEGNG